MRLPDSPCAVPGGCPNRRAEPNCHSTCEAFKEWSAAAAEDKARKRKAYEDEVAVVTVQMDQWRRFSAYSREQSQKRQRRHKS